MYEFSRIQGDGGREDKREAWQLFNEAYEQQMKGQLEEAVSLYKLSLATHQTAEAYTFLGWTYSFMGKLDEAIEECRKVHCLQSPRQPPITISAPI
ncbi:MAG: tetratricopeptide repeat protein [Nitrospira sp.]|nr:tetratricopeptide repeat protein [Nitrospira sp.]